jgi:hypothetical protein
MKNILLLPVLTGVAPAGVPAYCLLAENTAELRGSLLEKLMDSFSALQNKTPEKMKV